MQVKHYTNSFITAKVNNSTFVCDPWIGYGSENAWMSYPIVKYNKKFLENLSPNFIYISHLHCDHFDKEILKKIENKNCKIIIKKFKFPILKKRLMKLGFKKILELEPWKKCKISKEFTISIVPQMQSYTPKKTNIKNISDNIDYDLDTSIIIQDNFNKHLFYNNVDNPISTVEAKKIKKFIKYNYKNRISLFCTPVGAAGEYPQCFMNINRKEEKTRIIKEHISELKKQLKIFSPDYFFPAGGVYKVFGKFSGLNKYVAVPKKNELKKNLSKYSNYLDLLGGKSINLTNKKINFDNILKKNFKKSSLIKIHKKSNYFYEKDKLPSKEKIDHLFKAAQENYKKRLKNYNVKTGWKIKFKIFKKLTLSKDLKIHKKKSCFKQYEITNTISSKNKLYTELTLYLDLKLFHRALIKKCAWNPVLAGTTVMYERKPNKFDPTLLSSINFLTI